MNRTQERPPIQILELLVEGFYLPLLRNLILQDGSEDGSDQTDKYLRTFAEAHSLQIDEARSLIFYFEPACREYLGDYIDTFVDRVDNEMRNADAPVDQKVVTVNGMPNPVSGLASQFAHDALLDEQIAADIAEEKRRAIEDRRFNILTFDERLDLPIEKLELPERIRTIFRGAHKSKVRDIVTFQPSELLKWRGIGTKSVEKIEFTLDELGFHLGMDI